jgi:dephospho-CoA kinase
MNESENRPPDALQQTLPQHTLPQTTHHTAPRAEPPCEDFRRFKGAQQVLIGLTGGIGSGKSTVARLIQQAGHTVMSSDDIARDLMATNTALHDQIFAAFPHTRGANGGIDRTQLALTIFGDTPEHARALAHVNALVHPLVYQELAKRIGACFQRGERWVFNETALLFETGMVRCYDVSLVVDADEELRVQRLVEQRGVERSDAQRRIQSQMPTAEKRSRADYVLWNNGSAEDLAREVATFLQWLAERVTSGL